ncbi:hypothetical protein OS189_02455 [Sulfitobacter sp. F26169L]|uniref:hypothetical protein n=1 Tax=Sulfitobacter sp. F26169L TaxID=2996015 RepID=UPI002260E359|nr:hypothetical protein [Sulfitobacter sp. F26169L]MCX7565205.1 hypothetical protein [Sulfitobacter sp. F26169L]
MFNTRKMMMIVSLMGALVAASACTTEQVVDNTVSTTGFVAKTAVKGTIGAGKLAVKGVKAARGTE